MRRLLVSREGDVVRGVQCVDRVTGTPNEIMGRVVVLCASTLESTRMLLNPASERHPTGLANSSGTLGRYLIDHTHGISLGGTLPPGMGREDRQATSLIPAFRNITESGVEFTRSYGIQVTTKNSRYWMSAFGEVLPHAENRVTIDPTMVDAWGIPVLHVNYRYGTNEAQMARDQMDCMKEIAEEAGFPIKNTLTELFPGRSVHEMGTARMGHDPGTSVLNSFNQTWDVRNLFVTEGACFPSGGFQNPTLTMMALTVRACDHIAGRFKAGGF